MGLVKTNKDIFLLNWELKVLKVYVFIKLHIDIDGLFHQLKENIKVIRVKAYLLHGTNLPNY